MSLQTFVACVWAAVASFFYILWRFARSSGKRWQDLEHRTLLQNRELSEKLAVLQNRVWAEAKFRARPGMETVSDAIMKRIMDLEAENLKLTGELGEIQLQAAKYMDLYREERYKPHRKHT